jgi:mRNA interferase MazF
MFEQGDIILIPIPFTDLTSNKKRPVLILSSNHYNNITNDLIVVAITSNTNKKTHTIPLMNDNLLEGALPHISCIRADKLYTLSQSIVIRKFGNVKNDLFLSVIEQVYGIIHKYDHRFIKSVPQVYIKGSLEAVELYKKAFNLNPSPEMTAYNDDGTYEHISLMYGEKEIIAVAEDANDLHDDNLTKNKLPVMAFNVSGLGTREAVDHAYFILSAEARINENPNGPAAPGWDDEGNAYWFSLMDKFGVYWGVGK